jgi:hypothetical protein
MMTVHKKNHKPNLKEIFKIITLKNLITLFLSYICEKSMQKTEQVNKRVKVDTKKVYGVVHRPFYFLRIYCHVSVLLLLFFFINEVNRKEDT